MSPLTARSANKLANKKDELLLLNRLNTTCPDIILAQRLQTVFNTNVYNNFNSYTNNLTNNVKLVLTNLVAHIAY